MSIVKPKVIIPEGVTVPEKGPWRWVRVMGHVVVGDLMTHHEDIWPGDRIVMFSSMFVFTGEGWDYFSSRWLHDV